MQDYLIKICQDNIIIPAEQTPSLDLKTDTDCIIPFTTPTSQLFSTKTSAFKVSNKIIAGKRRHSSIMYPKGRSFINVATNEQQMVLS